MKLSAEVVAELTVKPGKAAGLARRNTAHTQADWARLGVGVGTREAFELELESFKQELSAAQELLWANGSKALLVILQALDAAGKDGTIKHVMSGVNPQGCRVTSFKRPSDTELRHDFLWRCSTALPERGCIGIFNRSYYEDVLVVRIHPELLAEAHPGSELWRQRFQDITGFERHLARSGTTIVKCFLHISKDEQRRRFLERLDDPLKQWKFVPADLAEREHFEAYQEAYEEALTATSTEHAPWYVIPADNKHSMRALIAGLLVHTVDALDLRPPVPDAATRKELAAARAALIAEGPPEDQPGAMSTKRE